MGLIMGFSFAGSVRSEMMAPAMQLWTLLINAHPDHMIYQTHNKLQTWYGSFDSLPVIGPKQPIHFSSSIQIPTQ